MVLLTFVLFTGLIAGITFVLTRGDDHDSSEGYFLAGRRLTGPFIAGSLLLTNLSTEQMVGLNGAAFADGLSVMAWEIVAVTALLFVRRLWEKKRVADSPPGCGSQCGCGKPETSAWAHHRQHRAAEQPARAVVVDDAADPELAGRRRRGGEQVGEQAQVGHVEQRVLAVAVEEPVGDDSRDEHQPGLA